MNTAAGDETNLIEAWARGVAMNPQAPSECLIRLLGPPGRVAWETLCGQRALPDEVVDAIVAHPETLPRITLARSPYATQRQRGRLERGTLDRLLDAIEVMENPGEWPRSGNRARDSARN